ncbi:YdcH family protein [Tsuneonella sp. CC-YZS046]|uniref:YdcH family protein n=1 Tax=Tsuneonella sp. CC-YZS046 TaxID=3042152 RepID=UPI002D778302|nr:YdcH family protein [Tsuneonella sp. CC-YZS046]WRO66636.1 YdcH family protein [Tsuneonella sp. CC-YZS046]
MSDHLLNYLYREHARLEGDLAKEARRVLPDQIQIVRLKKLKLAVKDQIAQAEKASRQVEKAA